ncbi:MAG: hypothetical protein IMW83_08830 [Caldanaerobacter subterraneus]|nr:hypothetical protein [Caldanaerobacter subterraneus]
MKKTNYLLISLLVICLIFPRLILAQSYYKEKYNMTGYSYSIDGSKIEDIIVKIIESDIKDGSLSGKAVLVTSTDSILLKFNNLRPQKLSSGEFKDYTGIGIAHTKEGDMDVAIAIDKNLDRIAGSIDYNNGNSIRVYNFLAGKDIPSLDLIRDKINRHSNSSHSESPENVSILGIEKLADRTANGIHIQVYGPSSVSRNNPSQPYQIRVRQNIYTESWVSVSHIKIWGSPPRNGGEGLWIQDVNPHTRAVGTFSITIPFIGVTINTAVAGVTENHTSTGVSWYIIPTDPVISFYDGPDSSTNPTAVEMYLVPIAGSGTYVCTGYVSAEFKFYDALNRYYNTKINSDVPYSVTIY